MVPLVTSLLQAGGYGRSEGARRRGLEARPGCRVWLTSELALRSLAVRAGELTGLAATPARLQDAADAVIGMRAAWQQVDLIWNTVITERRLMSTLAMSEASDLLLRMGRLVWDNPQWTPARAGRGPRRDPAALAPGMAAFTAVVSATHQAAEEPLCRRHHRARQADGWQLEQPEPGVLRWHTPSGRSYTTTPTEYPV